MAKDIFCGKSDETITAFKDFKEFFLFKEVHNDDVFNDHPFSYIYSRCKLNINSNKLYKLGTDCFAGSRGLFDLRFPASIKEINVNAFNGIYKSGNPWYLHSLIFEGNCPTTASAIFNDNYDPNLKIYYYENTEGWTSTFGNANIPTQQVFRGD